MRQNWLSNRVFKSFDDIVDHCCYAWNTLIDQPWKIGRVQAAFATAVKGSRLERVRDLSNRESSVVAD